MVTKVIKKIFVSDDLIILAIVSQLTSVKITFLLFAQIFVLFEKLPGRVLKNAMFAL